jgi:hypothetical protein
MTFSFSYCNTAHQANRHMEFTPCMQTVWNQHSDHARWCFTSQHSRTFQAATVLVSKLTGGTVTASVRQLVTGNQMLSKRPHTEQHMCASQKSGIKSSHC